MPSARYSRYLGITGFAMAFAATGFFSWSALTNTAPGTLIAAALNAMSGAPTCTLVADPSVVDSGDATKLSWTTNNAASGSIDQGIGNMETIKSGSVTTGKLSTTTIFTATVKSKKSQKAQCSVTVPVEPPSVKTALTISPNPCVLGKKNSCTVNVSWQARGLSTTTGVVWMRGGTGAFSRFACRDRGTSVPATILASTTYEFRLYEAASCTAAMPTQKPLGSVSARAITTMPATPAMSIGINAFDLPSQYQGMANGSNGSAEYRALTKQMGQKAIFDMSRTGARFTRVAITGYGPSTYATTTPHTLSLWITNPAQYWATMDEMMNDLAAQGMAVVPVFVWNLAQFPALTGETRTDFVSNPDSKSYKLLTKYVGEFVARYKNSPTLYFYELTNELNLLADINVTKSGGCSTPGDPVCWVLGNFTTNDMIGFSSRLAAHIRSLDQTHLISTGYSIPRAAASHLRIRPQWSTGGGDFTQDTQTEFADYLIDVSQGADIVSFHMYSGSEANQRFGYNFGTTSAEMLVIYKQVVDNMNKVFYVGEFGDANPTLLTNGQAPYTVNMLRKISQIKVPFSSPWVWALYQFNSYSHDSQAGKFSIEPGYTDEIITEIRTNNALLNSTPATIPPSAQPPVVIITWPIDKSIVPSASQLVYATASDRRGLGVAKVDFLVDGSLVATAATAPYQFTLNTSTLSAGTHTITARAVDIYGMSSASSVTVTR